MSLHDAYARYTPYELAFPDPDDADALVARVDEEASGRGTDPSDPNQFVTMGSVAAYVGRLRVAGADPEAVHDFGPLVYHAVGFVRADRPVYLLGTHAARYLVEGAPDGAPLPPGPSGYLQLPQHLFWAETAEDVSPESVDGVFWTATEAGVLHSMLAMGLRPDRPGLAVVPLPEAPLADAPSWAREKVRLEGEDFATELPGSELDRLYSFRTAGEVLKLLARFFAYAGAEPAALERRTPRDHDDDEDGPRASALPYARVVLRG